MKNTINNIDTKYAEAEYELQYRDLLLDVMENHVIRDNERTGIGCASAFSLDIDIDISKHFPILSGRKMFPHIFKSEFNWFING